VFGANKLSIDRWHSRLEHPVIPTVERILKNNKLPNLLDSNKNSVCGACQQAKSHQLPYSISTSVSTQPLELVFSDVWGPTIDSVGRYKYYASFIDDFRKFSCIYLLKYKYEVLQNFMIFKIMLNIFLIRRLLLFGMIGVGSMRSSVPSSLKLEQHIWFLFLTPTNKMVPLKE
jgi:hypothetical protein